MTREEAIAELNVLHERLSNPRDCEDGCYSWEDGWYVEAIDMAIEALHREEAEANGWCHRIYPKPTARPKGEWIDNTNGTFTCDQCGCKHSKSRFCPNCGAEMEVEHE